MTLEMCQSDISPAAAATQAVTDGDMVASPVNAAPVTAWAGTAGASITGVGSAGSGIAGAGTAGAGTAGVGTPGRPPKLTKAQKKRNKARAVAEAGGELNPMYR